MLWGGVAYGGGLELRRESDGGVRLSGHFPYGEPAVLSDGGRTGRPQKEIIAPRAFAYRVDDPKEDIHLLVGHSFDAPLASKGTGTLQFTDTDNALTFRALITRQIADTTHGRDVLALIGAGLAVGISPGFRIPPKRAVAEAETVEDEPDRPDQGMHRAVIRTVRAALLYEMSVVTRPAYPKAQIEARDWQLLSFEGEKSGLHRTLNRWRA